VDDLTRAGDVIGLPEDMAPETARSAALTICDRAADAGDARLLLEICGLLPYAAGRKPKQDEAAAAARRD
jgi:hypothetical protein